MKRWEELEDGRFKLTILSDDPSDGVPPSVYRGTKDEIAEMLAESQGNANRRIAELRRGQSNGHVPPQPPAPKPLTDQERLQSVVDLDNPNTFDRAITRVVETVIGETAEQRRTRQQQEDAQRIERDAVAAASQFASETPEWFSSDYNKNTLYDYMKNVHGHDWPSTNVADYTRAFEELSAAKLLQPKPRGSQTETESEDEDEQERNAPAPVAAPRTPSRISTGVSQRDISGLPPRPTTRLKYSREQLAEMSAATYKQLVLTDGKELARCEDYYAQHPVRRAG